MRRSDVTWIVVGGVVGVVVVLVGLAVLGVETAAIGLLLPLAVLGGGLLWAADGARAAALADGTHTGSETTPISPADPSVRSAPPVVVSSPDAVDAPTIVRPASDGQAESISEAVRVEAARSFDLDAFLVDDRPDRIQCAQCGRYSALVAAAGRQVTCEDCGATRPLSEVQPDTLVRTFVVPTEPERPEGAGPAPTSTTPPTRSQGG